MVNFGADLVETRSSAHVPIFDAWTMGFSHLSKVGVGTGIREVIYIGVGDKVVGLRVCGSKEVKYGRRYARAMKDP